MTTADWTFVLAYVVAPAVVVGVGYVAVLLHERAARRHHPGE